MLGISLYSSYLFTNNGTMEQWASILENGSEWVSGQFSIYN